MNNSNKRRMYVVMMLMLPILVLPTSSGCIRQIAQIMYVIKGHQIPAKHSGLNGKRVAVVCVSDQTNFGQDTLTYTVSKYVSVKLKTGLKETDIISPPKIENWIDEHGWDPGNVVAMGKDLDAQRVVVIEIGAYSIHEGATLYKGRAEVAATVYDIEKDGQITFAQPPEEYTFPKHGRPAIQTNERQFETFYLARLTDHISKLFVPYDKMDSFADDAMMD